MTRKEIAARVADRLEISIKLTNNVIAEALNEILASVMDDGETVVLRGFGTFRRVERRAHKGRNPQNGEWVEVPAKEIFYFRPAKATRNVR